jgi:hypothetical protein
VGPNASCGHRLAVRGYPATEWKWEEEEEEEERREKKEKARNTWVVILR